MSALVAELDKLRTLPLAVAAAVGTVVVGAVLGAALAAAAREAGVAATVVDVVAQALLLLQAGIVLLGVVPFGHEQPGQLRTSLAAVPGRVRLAAAKTAAAALALAVTAVVTIAATAGAAAVVLRGGAEDGSIELEPLLGAATALLLVGLLAHALALLAGSLVPALVVGLALVLVVSPLLGAVTEHARWLPDRAAALLLGREDPVLAPAAGALVALGWIAVVGAAGLARLVRRDV